VNPYDDPAAAAHYEDWYDGPGSRTDALEKRLLRKLLLPSVTTILDVGSGSGHSTRWFRGSGYLVVGADSSKAMLAEANRRTYTLKWTWK
jgi:trans-aconitate methyltransferase